MHTWLYQLWERVMYGKGATCPTCRIEYRKHGPDFEWDNYLRVERGETCRPCLDIKLLNLRVTMEREQQEKRDCIMRQILHAHPKP